MLASARVQAESRQPSQAASIQEEASFRPPRVHTPRHRQWTLWELKISNACLSVFEFRTREVTGKWARGGQRGDDGLHGWVYHVARFYYRWWLWVHPRNSFPLLALTKCWAGGRWVGFTHAVCVIGEMSVLEWSRGFWARITPFRPRALEKPGPGLIWF